MDELRTHQGKLQMLISYVTCKKEGSVLTTPTPWSLEVSWEMGVLLSLGLMWLRGRESGSGADTTKSDRLRPRPVSVGQGPGISSPTSVMQVGGRVEKGWRHPRKTTEDGSGKRFHVVRRVSTFRNEKAARKFHRLHTSKSRVILLGDKERLGEVLKGRQWQCWRGTEEGTGEGTGEEEDHWQSDSVMLSNQEETKQSFPPPTSSGDLSASLGSATDLESLAKSFPFSGPQFPSL